MLDFRRITLLCLEKRRSKAQNDYFLKIWGDMAPLLPLATPMVVAVPVVTSEGLSLVPNCKCGLLSQSYSNSLQSSNEPT